MAANESWYDGLAVTPAVVGMQLGTRRGHWGGFAVPCPTTTSIHRFAYWSMPSQDSEVNPAGRTYGILR